jgi:hypothetical protein
MVFDTFWTGGGTVFGVKTHKSLEAWVKSTDAGGSQVLVCWTGTFWICQVDVPSVIFFNHFLCSLNTVFDLPHHSHTLFVPLQSI